jgi:hypothetical protein
MGNSTSLGQCLHQMGTRNDISTECEPLNARAR